MISFGFAVRYNTWNRREDTINKSEHLKWTSTIATALYPTATDIYVVFEKREGFYQHEVRLLQNEIIVKRQEVIIISKTGILKQT